MADKANGKLNKAISVIIGIIAAMLIVSAIILLVVHYWPVKSNYSNYLNNVSLSEPLPENPVNFAKFKKQNQDICGFIDIDSLDIHEPIVCAGPEKEENYYLRRDLKGEYSTGGTVYIQKKNSVNFSDPCTVIYGHNMGNLTMFGRLKEFREKDFFDKNEYFRICTPGHVLNYSIKAAFVYDDRHVLNAFNYFENESDFTSFAEEVNEPKSLVKNVRESTVIKADSKLAVLSTCTNIKSERYLVVGVLTEDIRTK